MPASRNSEPSPSFESKTNWLEYVLALLLLCALSAASVSWFYQHGYLLYYGDAEAHLNIARRIVDSRTPGYDQFGTAWLPLLHALILPLVANDYLWRTGLAGSIPAAVCFVIAGMFLFASASRIFRSRAATISAVSLFALNPNLLYLQSTAMTEAVFFAALFVLLYATLRFARSQSIRAVYLAGGAILAASLARYEGWFLIPFVAAYFLFKARKNKIAYTLVFCLLASLGPVYWMVHNAFYYGDPLEFYRGPYSAKGIYERALASGMARSPGDHDWPAAFLYYWTAAEQCAGKTLFWLGVAGAGAALWKKLIWPLALLMLPPVFYVWSLHSAGTPIFVPNLWPHSYYNTRYGLAVLPLLALSAGAIVIMAPARYRAVMAVLLVSIGVASWLIRPGAENWICWKESQVNSVGRRQWTKEAADFLGGEYRRRSGIATSFGNLTAIFREANIQLSETLHDGNNPEWEAVVARPQLFLHEEWAVAVAGDSIATAIVKAGRDGPQYRCVKLIAAKGEPVVEIYKRDSTWLRPPAVTETGQ